MEPDVLMLLQKIEAEVDAIMWIVTLFAVWYVLNDIYFKGKGK